MSFTLEENLFLQYYPQKSDMTISILALQVLSNYHLRQENYNIYYDFESA